MAAVPAKRDAAPRGGIGKHGVGQNEDAGQLSSGKEDAVEVAQSFGAFAVMGHDLRCYWYLRRGVKTAERMGRK
ncbi:hypothetical protein CV_3279 [Chromobacterium violaceum ATCC 12472]|uniref:Uncharacterized protein n=1 Tax=Chromobacterium violaceum (strain ATCC 12472 / DSM 30191 / JCM 1249 / CCUG 213 / NBRC 12614 / NCIMB 9131 / NCTC 9757 / MK) TaxID=243365 RepID=Q7NSZ0_CHRVO|nr:hypothetical protein CV_3279 [Chromobacterium violaceum ATCC 12472]